jgi:hypothetical protein
MGSEATTSRRRILDYLNDGEELGVEGLSTVAGTPRAVVAARSLLPRFRWTRMARLGRKGCGGSCGVKRRSPQQPEEEVIAVEAAVDKGEFRESSGASGACRRPKFVRANLIIVGTNSDCGEFLMDSNFNFALVLPGEFKLNFVSS